MEGGHLSVYASQSVLEGLVSDLVSTKVDPAEQSTPADTPVDLVQTLLSATHKDFSKLHRDVKSHYLEVRC